MSRTKLDTRSRVLVADDDATCRVLLTEALEAHGFVVEVAADGNEALELFQRRKPDLAVLDLIMPELDGFEVCSAMRQTVEGAHVPIMMLTGVEDLDSIHTAYEVGATDFMTKPINYTIFVQRVRYMLRAKQLSDSLRQRERQLVNAHRIARLSHWSWIADSDQIFVSGCLVDELSGGKGAAGDYEFRSFLEKVHPGDRDRFRRLLDRAASHGTPFRCEIRYLSAHGEYRCCEVDGEVDSLRDADERIVAGTLQDIHERRQNEAKMRYLAYFDNVTGLPNRTFLKELLSSALEERSGRGCIAVLYLDLDNFKRINDTLGHDAGDVLLREVARRLSGCIRHGDEIGRADLVAVSDSSRSRNVVSRLGGDEFVIVLNDLRGPEDAQAIVDRISDELSRPFKISGTEVVVSASIGISSSPQHGDDFHTLLKHADVAMYEAKGRGRDGYQFFTDDLHRNLTRRFSIENCLRRAIDNGDLEVHYQPKVKISDRRFVGMEALVRWPDAPCGPISPAEFIPVAEETGLIVPLSDQVLRCSCERAKRLVDRGLDDFRVSVNLSPAQFVERGLGRKIESVLLELGLEPRFLELELTETLLMENTDSSMAILSELEKLGVELSIDDFGTGYSSLGYLKSFPLSALKIDQSFVREVTESIDNAVIVNATIALAQSLKLRVIAEGIETEEQLDFLARHGCEEGQGFLFGKPMPFDEFEAWLEARQLLPQGSGSAT